MADAPLSPPQTENSSGHPRRVGVELEYAGLDVTQSATLVAEVLGGTRIEETVHRQSVRDTPFGTFLVELDTLYVHPDKDAETPAPREDEWHRFSAEVEQSAKTLLGHAVSGFVPIEIVCPPLAWSDLSALTPLFEALRTQGARGTGANPVYGFGLHLNPEVAEETASYILSHLRAFFILAPELRARSKTDMTRQVLPHANPFPRDYICRVLARGYAPDLGGLIDDYARANPTRNRELDLYPLFAHLDARRVARHIEDPRIKPRPTFHYRLPDCRLSQPGWSAVTEWNRWLEVERLAADPERLSRAASATLKRERRPAVLRWFRDRLSGRRA